MLGFETDNPPTPDLVAHIIQVSLSPIFLLTALGTLTERLLPEACPCCGQSRFNLRGNQGCFLR